jgi:sorbitol/mannitol transport system permease protein
MSRKIKRDTVNVISVLIALLWIFPIIYMMISSFKTESQVIIPGIFFKPTLENYQAVVNPEFYQHLVNSIIITCATVIFSTILAVSASYGLVFTPLKKPDKIYFWFVSTTFLPAVAVIAPVYFAFKKINMIDSYAAMILLYVGAGTPLMVWLVTTFFKEIPIEIIEAADIDGSSRLNTFFKIMLPLTKNGIVSAALLVFITTWNEFFFAVTITYTNSSTLSVYMSKYMVQQGYFWGKMCAAATMIVIIPIAMGFFTQKSLVKGLAAGSVKG